MIRTRTRILPGLLIFSSGVLFAVLVDGVLDGRQVPDSRPDVRHAAASATRRVGSDAPMPTGERVVSVGQTAAADPPGPGEPDPASAEDSMPHRKPTETSPARRPLRTTVELARSGGGAGVSDEVRASMDRMAMDFARDLEPSYHGGQIDGIRAANVTEGGLLDEAGVNRDDVIRELNGVKIDSPDAAQRILRDLARCQPMTALVSGSGGDRVVEITGEMLRKFSCTQ